MTTAVKKSNPFARNHLIRDGISRAIYDSMQTDQSIYLFGEGCEVKQHYDAPYILEKFADRVVTLPISEDGNVNFAVGASLLGLAVLLRLQSGVFCVGLVALLVARRQWRAAGIALGVLLCGQ